MAKKNDTANKPVYKDIYKDFDDEVIPDEFVTFILEGGELKRNKDYQFIEDKGGSITAIKCPSTKEWRMRHKIPVAVPPASVRNVPIDEIQGDIMAHLLSDKDPWGETPTQQKIRNIMDAMKDLLLYKNQKYGDSAINPKKIFYKGDSTNSILIRLDDKLGRVMSNTEEKPRVNDVADIIGYCTLLLISMGVTADDISKFKD